MEWSEIIYWQVRIAFTLSVGFLLWEIWFYAQYFHTPSENRVRKFLLRVFKIVGFLFVYSIATGIVSFFFLNPEYRGSLMLFGLTILFLLLAFYLERNRSNIKKINRIIEQSVHRTVEDIKEFSLEEAIDEMEQARRSQDNNVPKQILKNLHLRAL